MNHLEKKYEGKPSTAVERERRNEGALKMDLFWETLDILQSKYVDEQAFENDKLLFGAITGMVNSLEDPYTVFMDPKENKDFRQSLAGELQGIGAELTMKEGLLTVVSPLKNSPASKAGLRPEDIVVKINNEETADFTLEQAVMRIRGPKGTSVLLTILHKEEDETNDISITRDVINIDSVSWEMTKNTIAHLSINQFGETTTLEFQNAIGEILLKQPKGLIVDLRFNSGGYLDSSVKIVSEFLEEEKPVVSIKKRNGDQKEVYETTGGGRMLEIPIVVLINKGSASASEIVAGALQDYKRAHIMGEQSFGKGTVQEVEPLTGGSSLRVTIAKWHTPNGISISEKGITPDEAIEMSVEDYKEKRDPQLDAAIEYLKKL